MFLGSTSITTAPTKKRYVSYWLKSSLAAQGTLTYRLKRRTASKFQNGNQGITKWMTGSGKVSISWLLGALVNFSKISFLIRALLLWEMSWQRKKQEKKKNITFLVAVASWQPKCWPTGTPTACSNFEQTLKVGCCKENIVLKPLLKNIIFYIFVMLFIGAENLSLASHAE